MPVRAVLLDLDDTLFDHVGTSQSAVRALRDEYQCFRAWTLAELERANASAVEELHARVLAGELTIDEARLARFRRLLERHVTADLDERAREAAAFYRTAYRAARRPVPGARALLERLAGVVRVAVVSNNVVSEQRDKLAHLGFDALVDELVCSEEVGVAKPAPRIFEEALARVRCRADESVMVGDSWTADVLGARGAGIRPVWLNRGGAPCPDASLAAELRSLDDLEEVIRVVLL